jgi:hypothetical protein
MVNRVLKKWADMPEVSWEQTRGKTAMTNADASLEPITKEQADVLVDAKKDIRMLAKMVYAFQDELNSMR